MLQSPRDQFHPPPNDDRWWTETCWFSFDQPGQNLSATFYPLFRPNLGICSLGIYLWDASEYAPWRLLYRKFLWHLAMPTTELTSLELEGLRYDCLEPEQRFRVRYEDGDLVTVDLTYEGLRDVWVASESPQGGHTDQPCAVTGTVRLGDQVLEIDCFGMRDRTWSPRPDDHKGGGTGYTYGIGSDQSQFLMLTRLHANEGVHIEGVFRGYLVRDGIAAPMQTASRKVVSRVDACPMELEVAGVDELGRSFSATGRRLNTIANQATPGQFAWMSMYEWQTDDGVIHGEDQEVWTLDMLGARLVALDTDGAT
jgi:hypothetical protein